jgi:hypothetical protein
MGNTTAHRKGFRGSRRLILAWASALLAASVMATAAGADTGGISGTGGTSGGDDEGGGGGGVSGTYCSTTKSYPIITSKNKACAPQSAPQKVKDVIQAANVIRNKPYRWGGGHSGWGIDSGYDCSGAVSYALHAQGETGWLSYPMNSGGLANWALADKGAWITVFAHSGHVYLRIGQPGQPKLRWDTSGTGGSGPSWTTQMRSPSGFKVRHPNGY